MKIVFIAKGNTRKKRTLHRAVRAARDSDLFREVVLLQTTAPGHAIELARQASEDADYLIAAGGDGTPNEVLNGCLQTSENFPANTPPVLGVLALGTANDFLKSTASGGKIDDILSLVAGHCERRIDVGRVRYAGDDGDRAQRYFANVADVGIGATVAQKLNRSARSHGANLLYLRAVFSTFFTYSKRQLTVRSDQGLSWHGRTLALIVGNGGCFGSGLHVVPQAILDDGKFSVALIGDVTVLDFIRKLSHLRNAEPIEHPQITYHEATRLEVASPDGPCAVEVDGEYLGETPLVIDILPARVRFLMPPA